MTDAFPALAGLAVGGIIAWFLARSHTQRSLATELSALQSAHLREMAALQGRARGAEAVVDELRVQVKAVQCELTNARLALDHEQQAKIEAMTRLEVTQKGLDEQRTLLEGMKAEMTDTFNALSAAALKSSSEDFLRLAAECLGGVVSDTKGKLGEHQMALDGTIKPLLEMLRRSEQLLNDVDEKRHASFVRLAEQIKTLSSMQETLQRETSNLVTALRKPQVSGSWGQMSLKRAAELAGMTAYCDFYEQESVRSEAGRLRPDMIVRLPNGREIVVDAKAPVDAYLSVITATCEDEQKKAIAGYVKQVRTHMNALSSKSYWDQFPQSPELVVMFLPGESFFSAALEHDPKLIEDGSMKKVILSTPTTFIALLKAVAYGWQQEQLTKNAQEISKLGREVFERFSVVIEHFSKTGSALQRAVSSYNEGASSLAARLVPTVRKFKEFGISTQKEVQSPVEVDQVPKKVEALGLDFKDNT